MTGSPRSALACRLAVPSEQRLLEDLQRRASLDNPGDREALLANPGAIVLPIEQIAIGHVFVAERQGVVLGFAAVVPRNDGDSELDALFVEPDAWRQGVGRALVEHCADVAHARGSAALHVTGNPHAEGFYLACGFTHVGTIHTRFGPGQVLRHGLQVTRPASRVTPQRGPHATTSAQRATHNTSEYECVPVV